MEFSSELHPDSPTTCSQEREGNVPTTDFALSLGTWGKNPNRQGIPSCPGAQPMNSVQDLHGADVAVLGVPFVSPLIGYENDVAPRKVRAAGQNYMGTYIS